MPDTTTCIILVPHPPRRHRSTSRSKRSQDERSDIREMVPFPHVAALMRATCLCSVIWRKGGWVGVKFVTE